jgi:hypothetical protein
MALSLHWKLQVVLPKKIEIKIPGSDRRSTELPMYSFYVTSWNILSIYEGGNMWLNRDILDTGDRSTFVPLGSDIKEVWVYMHSK